MQMRIVAQEKVVSGIYKVIRTKGDEIAIAASTGLYFCKYNSI